MGDGAQHRDGLGPHAPGRHAAVWRAVRRVPPVVLTRGLTRPELPKGLPIHPGRLQETVTPRLARRTLSRRHDEIFRGWLGLEVAGIHLQREAVHETADGRRLLVIHGDEFDSVVRYARLLALLGDWAYTQALRLNRAFNGVRRCLGYPYWSLSQWLKLQVKGAVKAIDRFEQALAGEALRRSCQGVVCGHIHHAEMRRVGKVSYMNCGDWVESCTALVEHPDGRFELIDWAAVRRLSLRAEPQHPVPAPA